MASTQLAPSFPTNPCRLIPPPSAIGSRDGHLPVRGASGPGGLGTVRVAENGLAWAAGMAATGNTTTDSGLQAETMESGGHVSPLLELLRSIELRMSDTERLFAKGGTGGSPVVNEWRQRKRLGPSLALFIGRRASRQSPPSFWLAQLREPGADTPPPCSANPRVRQRRNFRAPPNWSKI